MTAMIAAVALAGAVLVTGRWRPRKLAGVVAIGAGLMAGRFVAVLAGVVFLLTGCASAPADAATPRRYAAVGDSITAGAKLANPDVEKYAAVAGISSIGRPGSCLVTAGCYGWATLVDDLTVEIDSLNTLGPRPVRVLIVEIGINDINVHRGTTFEQITGALAQLRTIAATKKVRIVYTTITPWAASRYGTGLFSIHEDQSELRDQVNAWILANGPSINFSRVLSGADGKMLPAYDSGDGLHPNAAGQAALGAAVKRYMARHP